MLNSIFVGNEKAKKMLLDPAVKPSSHAILLYGDSGLGKMKLARLLACRHVLGEDLYSSETNLLENNTVRLILDNIHPDVKIVGEDNGIKVDDIREVIKWISYKPNQGQNKVCILQNCESMTREAQNAILKSLEEPPSSTVIIMHTNKRSKMLETILSRVQSVEVQKVTHNECVTYIKEEYPDLDEQEIQKCCSIFEGNIGRCIDGLQSENNDSAFYIAGDIAVSMAKGSIFEIAKNFERIKSNRQLYLEVVERLMEIMQNLLMIKAGCSKSNNYASLADKLSYAQIAQTIKKLSELQKKLVFNPNLSLSYSWLAVELGFINR